VAASVPLVVPLAEAASLGEDRVGGKAAKLSALKSLGYRVPEGFCITARAYRRFLEFGKLRKTIDIEMGRKPMSTMRWEEIWDAALRIRTAFLRAEIPPDVSKAIADAYRNLHPNQVAARSSSVGEDSAERSYAGLHESVVGVLDEQSLFDAIRVVWASLWSDAAMLYRHELELDATTSAMAVVVQEVVAHDRSGVAFGIDPRNPEADVQVIEAVPGLCKDLVDGTVDPDRWLVRRADGEQIEWRQGVRNGGSQNPLLGSEDLVLLHRTLNSIESDFGWPPDMEWTGRGSEFTVLQARPVTAARPDSKDDQRGWYLSLRPGKSRLEDLCKRVVDELIPELEEEGNRLARQSLEDLSDERLADALDEREEIFSRWKKIYWDDFIPFAHGVRQLGTYYNDAVKPDDPYEFLNILKHQPMLAGERNIAMQQLADRLKVSPILLDSVRNLLSPQSESSNESWSLVRARIAALEGGSGLLDELQAFCDRFFNVVHGGESLDARPDIVLHAAIELTDQVHRQRDANAGEGTAREHYEQQLLHAVGPSRRGEARSVIDIARLAWRLRDDDNILLSRVESQLHRAANIAAHRLEGVGRLEGRFKVTAESLQAISDALRNPGGGSVILAEEQEVEVGEIDETTKEKPRQIVGQPAAPGLATARARRVRTTNDLKSFYSGDVLLCDAIQPTMSHIVPLAAAIVERRGGMLIHGAIIARELGIPCVNGVSDTILSIANDELVTVDGYLGIVTIGPPEFDLETADYES